MGRTLLVGGPDASWREWLRTERKGRDVLVLDPSDSSFGPPGRFSLIRGDRPIQTRFYGSLDAARAPHVVYAALVELLPLASPEAIILCYPINGSPLLRQTLLLLAQHAKPSRILVAEGTPVDQAGFPVGPEPVARENTFPVVLAAQRKAQWLRLIEKCSDHVVPLAEVTIEGARLGSGRTVDPESVGLKAHHAEIAATTLFAVVDEEPLESDVARALDLSGCQRATFATPNHFRGLICSFARESGEDFGMGYVTNIDWRRNVLRAKCTAIPPAPVRIVRLGSIRLDETGLELGELKPWQV